jgi:hypothetical protein
MNSHSKEFKSAVAEKLNARKLSSGNTPKYRETLR